MEKILITGAGGFIGGHLVKELLDKGYDIRAVDIKQKQDWFQTFEALSLPSSPTKVTSQSKIIFVENAKLENRILIKSNLREKTTASFMKDFNLIVYEIIIKFI